MEGMWRSPQLASQVSRFKPTGLLCVGMDERTGLQCEGGNARCILDAADHIRNNQLKLLRATRTVHNRAAACDAVGGGIFENQL